MNINNNINNNKENIMSDEQQNSTYDRLLSFLNERAIPYREVEHSPEGRTDVVSTIRGNRLEQAVKAIVMIVKNDRKSRRKLLVCVQGDRRVSFAKVARAGGGGEARFAPPDLAESLTGCTLGSVPPISFNDELKVVVDPTLLEQPEVVFNAARLDRSLFVPARPFFEAVGASVAAVAE
jgi:Ala-tRNA(Pro) deacylase